MTGGFLNEINGYLAGFHVEEFVSQFQESKTFISAGGVSPDTHSRINSFEVQIKRNMMTGTEESFLVVTHHKIG
jgi:DeoR/GlpR family transcriptional regulator of sugar metabolism